MAEIKKKNKKKIGSNVDNLRNLEPQPEQTFLIKKNKCKECLSIYSCNISKKTIPLNWIFSDINQKGRGLLGPRSPLLHTNSIVSILALPLLPNLVTEYFNHYIIIIHITFSIHSLRFKPSISGWLMYDFYFLSNMYLTL